MRRICLSLSSSYLPGWGVMEAIREVIQNAQDSNIDGNPMFVEYKNGKLIVKNDGAVLDHSVLLLGNTSKTGRDDQAGKYGEGLKLAMLVCARRGLDMTIRNGPEVWIPTIEESDQFAGHRVLTVTVRDGNKDIPRFQVELAIEAEVWEQSKWKFLFIDKPGPREIVRTESGALLKGERYRGKIFVRGIFVCNQDGLEYGYDFKNAPLDRDRRVLASYEVAEHSRKILQEAMAIDAVPRAELYAMLERGAGDLTFSVYNAYETPELQAMAADEFIKKHGKDALPVTDMAQAADLEHLGVRGIQVNASMAALISQKLGTIDQVRKRLAAEVLGLVDLHELPELSRKHLTQAVDMLAEAEPALRLTLADVQVARFRDTRLRGMFKDGKALLSEDILKDSVSTLGVLIHEIAHRQGPDGDKAHVQEIERLWALVFRSATAS